MVHSDEKKAIDVDAIEKPLLKRFDGRVFIETREPRSTPLVQVLQELMDADVLIASKSSLSNTAGLYNLGQRPVLMPYDKARPGMVNLPGWYVVRDPAQFTNSSRIFYEGVVSEARKWRKKRRTSKL